MTITHIVSFQFKPDVSADSVKELITRMLALKEQCLHPETRKSYILSCTGGRDNSVQGLQNGLTHVFVVDFATKEDRDYYALEDPKHMEFVNWSDTVTAQVQAIDYVSGEF